MELCKEDDPKFYYLNKIFKVWFRAGELGQGQQCIDEQLQAVKENPENVNEWICLADAYYWEKHYELDPEMLESLFSIAWCHEELGDFAKAYEAWMRLVHIFEDWEDDVGVKFPMRQAEKCKGLMEK